MALKFVLGFFIYLPVIIYCVSTYLDHKTEKSLLEAKISSLTFIKTEWVSIAVSKAEKFVIFLNIVQLFLAICGVFNFKGAFHKLSILILCFQIYFFNQLKLKFPSTWTKKDLFSFGLQFGGDAENSSATEHLFYTIMVIAGILVILGDGSNQFRNLPGITPTKPYYDEFNPAPEQKNTNKKQKKAIYE